MIYKEKINIYPEKHLKNLEKLRIDTTSFSFSFNIFLIKIRINKKLQEKFYIKHLYQLPRIIHRLGLAFSVLGKDVRWSVLTS
nr:MAG TPA: hypothetical protein [Caudoviricetes sp.]